MDILTHFSPSEAPGHGAHFIKCLIEGIALGAVPMYAGWRLRPLYESGVRFALPNEHGSGFERFALPPETAAAGWGDCDRLVIWRLIELYAQGERRAGCHCQWVNGAYHVAVRRGNGALEDPSKILMRMYGQG